MPQSALTLTSRVWPPSTLCAVAKPSRPPLNGDWKFVTRHVVSPGKQFSTRVALPVVHEAAFGVAWTTSEFDDSVVPVRERIA